MQTLTSKDVKELMIDYLVKTQGIPPDVAADGSVKVESLGVDSLSLLEMLFEVEQKYDLHVDNLAPLKDMTIDAMAEFLANLQTTAPVGTAKSPQPAAA